MAWFDRWRMASRLLALLGMCATCEAQNFDYPDFTNASGLAFNANASISAPLLRVTPATGNQLGAVYYEQPVRVDGGFNTVFTFQFSNLGGGGADGMTFVIHNDPRGTAAIASAGGEMAYGAAPTAPVGTAIANSLVLELDTYFSGGEGDLSANEVSLHTGGSGDNDNDESYSLGRVSPAANLSDGLVHTARINFDSGVISVYLDDLVNPLFTANYDFANGGSYVLGGNATGMNLLPDGKAYVGFTAATGGAWETHDVLSWSWSSSGGPGTSYCFGDGTALVCPCGNLATSGQGCGNSQGWGGVLASNGSSSVVTANLQLFATQVPASKPGLFLLAATMENGGSGSSLGDGLRCVGMNPVKLQVVTADSSGMALTSIDLIAAGAIASGQTKAFQYWYRDPQGPCSSGRNSTNGLLIQFTP